MNDNMRKLVLIIFFSIFIIAAASFGFYHFVQKPEYSAYYSDGGYAVAPYFPPSAVMTMETINTIGNAKDEIDKQKIDEINSFLDKEYSLCNKNCDNYFLFEFVMAKKNLGFDEMAIRKNYGIQQTLLDRYNGGTNTDPSLLLAINEFNNPSLLTNDEKIVFVVSIFNATPNSSIDQKFFMAMTLTSCNFSSSELAEMKSTYLQEYTDFCTLPELGDLKQNAGNDFGVCTLMEYLTVKLKFCEKQLTEDEKVIVSGLLSEDYQYLNQKLCKKIIYNNFENEDFIR